MKITAPLSLALSLLSSSSLQAQFDLGASAGVFGFSFTGTQEGNTYAEAQVGAGPFFTASLFYRERSMSTVHLGSEIVYSHKEFDAQYANGGQGGGTDMDVLADLHLLHFTIAPEVKLSSTGNSVFRFGLQVGVLLGGTMTGSSLTWSHSGNSSGTEFTDAYASDFTGDVRAILGFGFSFPVGEREAITLDPFISPGLGSLLKYGGGEVKLKTFDIGIRVGWKWRMKGRSIGHYLGQMFPPPRKTE